MLFGHLHFSHQAPRARLSAYQRAFQEGVPEMVWGGACMNICAFKWLCLLLTDDANFALM